MGSDYIVLALYKSASAEADVAESDLYLTIKANMMESEWKAYDKNDGIIAELKQGGAMSEPTDPRNFKLVKGSDLPVVLAAYSAMQTWPTKGSMGGLMDVAGMAMEVVG